MLTLLSGVVFAAGPVPKVSIQQLDSPPVIDGKLDDKCWQDSSWMTNFACGEKLADDQTWVASAYDSENIYFAFRCRQGRISELTEKYHKFMEQVCFDNDALEIFLQADPVGSPKKYFQMYMNSAGVQGMTVIGYSKKPNFVECKAAVTRNKEFWFLEIAVPFGLISEKTPNPGTQWRMSLCRDNTIGGEQTSWCNSGFHQPKRFGELAFAKYPPAVSVESLGDLFWGSNTCRVKVRNIADKNLALHGELSLSRGDWSMSEQALVREEFAPQKSHEFALTYNCWNNDINAFVVRVGSSSGTNDDIYRAIVFFAPPVFDKTVLRIENLLKAYSSISAASGNSSGISSELDMLKNSLPSLKEKKISKSGFDSLLKVLASAETAVLNAWAKSQDKDFIVLVRNSQDKLFSDKKLFYPLPLPEEQGSVRLSAAGNESESFQAVIYPLGGKDLKDVRISASDLKDEKGNIIPAGNIKIYLVGYVKVGLPPGLLREVGSNVYPDPLIPYFRKPVFDVKASSICPVWITVNVPSGTDAGKYKGSIAIKTKDSDANVNVNVNVNVILKVRAFSLPKTPTLRTAFQFWGKWSSCGMFEYWYPAKKYDQDEVYRKVYSLYGEHKASSDLIGLIHQGKDGNLDKSMEMIRFAVGKGFNAYGIYNFWGGMRAGTAEHMKRYAELLKKEDLLKYAFLYLWDEPHVDYFPKIVNNAGILEGVCPGVRRLVTTRPHAELAGAVTRWCPWGWSESPYFDERRKAGDEIWSYVCSPVPGHFSPHEAADYPGIYNRIMFWLCWKYNRSGFLLPCVDTNWQKGDIVSAWPKPAWDISTAWGNMGQYLYPTADGDVMPSLRFEIFRDGIEDYEYFYILKGIAEKLRKSGTDKALLAELEKALAAEPVVLNDKEFTKDPEALLKYRELIGDLIDREARFLPDENKPEKQKK